MHARSLRGLSATALALLLGACATSPRDRAADAKVVVIVKFRSSLPEAELRARYPKRMPAFRELPGLLQKYYMKEPKTGEWSGIYLWDSMASVQSYLQSDLKKSIPEAYGVVGEPRVEVFSVEDVLR